MRKLHPLIGLVLLASTITAGAQALKPLVIQGGQTKQLPAGATLQLNATGAGGASINMGQGTAPSSPNNGDCWITSAGLYCRYNGGTVGPFNTGSGNVSTSGAPASGNLAQFSGAAAITNGDLSGDCTTSGTLAIACTKTGGVAFAPSATTDTTNATNIGSGTLSNSRLNAAVVISSNNNSFTKAQRGTPVTVTIATATFTPSFDAANNFTMTLSSACPCTLANPSTTPVAGQSGVVEIIQDGTGSRAITTWGSQYYIAGGTSAIVLSTGANARDYFSYYVADATHIVLSQGAANATH